MRKLTLGLGTGLFFLSVWTACHAADVSNPQVIIEGGERAAGAVRTGGHAVPLLHALERIVPASYSVNMPNAGAWADSPVSWRPGPFVQVLGALLANNPALQARVNTDLHLVTVTAVALPPAAPVIAPALQSMPPAQSVRSVPSVPPSTSVAHSLNQTEAGLPVVQSGPRDAALPAGTPLALSVSTSPGGMAPTPGAAAPLAAPMPVAPPEQLVWDLRPSDGSIRNALARWAKEAGWQFVWDVPTDFSIDASATLHGTLETALDQVVKALSNSQVPIQVVMYKGNRVLRVIAKGAA